MIGSNFLKESLNANLAKEQNVEVIFSSEVPAQGPAFSAGGN